MNFKKNLYAVLEFLEKNICETHMAETQARHVAALCFDENASPVMQAYFSPEGLDPYVYAETYNNMEKMLYNELLACVSSVMSRDDGILGIRADYGVGTLPSLFGTADRITVDNLKPWTDPLPPGKLQATVKKGVPNLSNGSGAKVYETYSYYSETLSAYPKCKKHIHLYHPDLQGPFDTAHLLAGNDIYYMLYDDPAMVHELLHLVCETYASFYKKLETFFTDRFVSGGKCYCYHFKHIFGGNILLRSDTAVNLSSAQYDEFVKPYDELLLAAFGGGSIHFCGRADQWINNMFSTVSLRAINFGHMHKYDFGQRLLDHVYGDMTAYRVPVAAYFLDAAEINGLDWNKYKTGVTYTHFTEGLDETKRLNEKLRSI